MKVNDFVCNFQKSVKWTRSWFSLLIAASLFLSSRGEGVLTLRDQGVIGSISGDFCNGSCSNTYFLSSLMTFLSAIAVDVWSFAKLLTVGRACCFCHNLWLSVQARIGCEWICHDICDQLSELELLSFVSCGVGWSCLVPVESAAPGICGRGRDSEWSSSVLDLRSSYLK